MWLCNRFLRAAERIQAGRDPVHAIPPLRGLRDAARAGAARDPRLYRDHRLRDPSDLGLPGDGPLLRRDPAGEGQLVDTGEVPPERIKVTGVPIDPKFAIPLAAADARAALGLDPDPSAAGLLAHGRRLWVGPLGSDARGRALAARPRPGARHRGAELEVAPEAAKSAQGPTRTGSRSTASPIAWINSWPRRT